MIVNPLTFLYTILVQLPVSIIIPTLNEEKYLPILLKSIHDGTAQPAEIIVSDAYSLDSTREIAKSAGCKVVDGGLLPVGRNNGAKAATQPILLFLDSDGILPKTFLEKTIAEFQERKLGAASVFVKPISNSLLDYLAASLVNWLYLIFQPIRPHGYGCCLFATKHVHDAILGFDEDVLLAEDQDYVLRAAKKGKYRLLRSQAILTSLRRYAKEGRLVTTLKYAYFELHMIFIGKITKAPFQFSYGKHSEK